MSDTAVQPPPTRSIDPARLAFIPERPEDREVLIAWLTTDTWPFHGAAHLAEEAVRARLDAEAEAATTRAWWVVLDEASRVGRVVVEDLADLTAVASFRIRTPYRGRGIGLHMVCWAADATFRDYPDVERIEGQTRVDNLAMRRVFARAGWVAEAYYRRSWPDEEGVLHDSVGYALLRPDWASGTTTRVPWTMPPTEPALG